MLHYILQTIAFQLFFLIIYDVFLKKETFFNWNRAYLIVTALLSVVLPFIKIDSFKEVMPQQFLITLPEVIIGKLTQNESNLIIENGIENSSKFLFTWEHIFFLGVLIALGIFIYKLIKIAVLIYKNPKYWKDNLHIVKLINSNAAFSFFHYVFLGERIMDKDRITILNHESIHVKQKHSIDLLFFEILRILFWFNPLIYMYQNRISVLHEFIADAKAVKAQDKSQYYENLLAQVFETQSVSFINTFFKQSLIKKRIVMLTKSKSKQILKLKYIVLVPIVLGMLLYTSSNAQEKVLKEEVNQELSEFLIVIEKENNEIKLTCQEGCAWKELRFTLFENKSQAIDEFGMTAFPRNVSMEYSKFSNFLFTLSNVEDVLKLEGKEGTAWIDLSFTLFNNESQAINKNGMTSFDKGSENSQRNKVYNALLKEIESRKKEKEDSIKKSVNNTTMFLKSNNVTMLLETNSKDDSNTLEVPFATIDEVPIYPGCDNLSTNAERRKCMSDKITKHVIENFNTDLAGDLGLAGRQRVNVIFKIDENGNVIGIRSRAQHPDLEVEAIRVIKLLPRMTPGKQNGENVIVPYSLPIVFEVADKKSPSSSKETIIESQDISEKLGIPFSVVEKAPIYQGCETLATNTERRNCTSDKITRFVQKNFNTDLAGDLGLTGRQRINVIFKIDKEGNIAGIRTRALHPRLEEEAIRVISLLPKMTPGKQNGENVIVPYSLPIIFQVTDKYSITKKEGVIEEMIIKPLDISSGELEVPFAIIENAPIYQGCENLSTNAERRECTSDNINKFVQKNFNTDLAGDLGLSGRQRINTIFEIDKEGNITGIRSRATHPELEKEAIRVISLLPKMIPGKQNGKNVIVPYSLPIIFEVE